MASVTPEHDSNSLRCLPSAPARDDESRFLCPPTQTRQNIIEGNPSTFLCIPAEIRTNIYREVLTGETFVFTKDMVLKSEESQGSKCRLPAFLQTCPQIYHEAIPLYHILTEFQVNCDTYHTWFHWNRPARRQMAKFWNVSIIDDEDFVPDLNKLLKHPQLRHLRLDMSAAKVRWGALGLKINDAVDETTGAHRGADMLIHNSIIWRRVDNMRRALAGMRERTGIPKGAAAEMSVTLQFTTQAFIGPLQDEVEYEKFYCCLKLANDDSIMLKYTLWGVDYVAVQTP